MHFTIHPSTLVEIVMTESTNLGHVTRTNFFFTHIFNKFDFWPLQSVSVTWLDNYSFFEIGNYFFSLCKTHGTACLSSKWLFTDSIDALITIILDPGFSSVKKDKHYLPEINGFWHSHYVYQNVVIGWRNANCIFNGFNN